MKDFSASPAGASRAATGNGGSGWSPSGWASSMRGWSAFQISMRGKALSLALRPSGLRYSSCGASSGRSTSWRRCS
ncbi:hypothetical protein D3C71_1232970 [compost metagenome]